MRPLDAWFRDPYAASGEGWLDVAPDRFAARMDRREDFDQEPVDLGWIGEDAGGIWCRRDPYCVALEDPEVWPVLLTIWSGDHDVTRHDREALAAVDFVLKAHAVAAIRRWERERYKRDAESQRPDQTWDR